MDRETERLYHPMMNIKSFKEGDIITRNEPMTYQHNKSADGSWLGERLKFLAVDEQSKIIFLKDKYENDEPITISYARDPWDEGWILYPETLFKKFTKVMKGQSPQVIK